MSENRIVWMKIPLLTLRTMTLYFVLFIIKTFALLIVVFYCGMWLVIGLSLLCLLSVSHIDWNNGWYLGETCFKCLPAMRSFRGFICADSGVNRAVDLVLASLCCSMATIETSEIPDIFSHQLPGAAPPSGILLNSMFEARALRSLRSPCTLQPVTLAPVDLSMTIHKWWVDPLYCKHTGPPPDRSYKEVQRILGGSWRATMKVRFPWTLRHS